MNINVNGSGDYVLENGIITKEDGSRFEAKIVTGNLELSENGTSGNSNINIGRNGINISSGRGNSGISMNGNNISMNGVSMSMSGKTLTVKGSINKVIVNGKTYVIEKEETEKEKKSGIKEYILTEIGITGISIKGSGKLKIKDGTKISELLNLNIKGSGDIIISNYSGTNCIATIMGSGDILFKTVDIENINATIMGNGDINSRNSSFKNVRKTVMGNGDINLEEDKTEDF